jgi:serine/threonine-protein kinase
VSTEQNQYTLVFEFVPGTNLFDYLHKLHKAIPLGRQLGISTQICDAMAYVHDCNLVHRDLKPQNVIYQDKTGVAKLCDFGLARVVPNNMPEIHPAQVNINV